MNSSATVPDSAVRSTDRDTRTTVTVILARHDPIGEQDRPIG